MCDVDGFDASDGFVEFEGSLEGGETFRGVDVGEKFCFGLPMVFGFAVFV